MYSTCLFCRADLGKNEMIEHFPVGRRLAFDPAKGRLWVICPSCRQWCLSPLDERWEAVEDAERLHRETRLRTSTDQIGLARLRDGTDLVRIGEPLRPEFAAWRYGARFGARWRRTAALLGAGVIVTGAYIVAGPILGLVAGSAGAIPWNAVLWGERFIYRRRITNRIERYGGPLALTDAHARGARLIHMPGQQPGWQLQLPHFREDLRPGQFSSQSSKETDPTVILSGEEALHAARVILPKINDSGGTAATVREAVRYLESGDSPGDSFARAASESWTGGPRSIHAAPTPVRLALEMAAHEEIERRALEGELASLEAAWKEAEEIAAISDSLTLPERLGAQLDRLRV